MVKIEIILFVIIAVILLVLMSKSKFGSVYNTDNSVLTGSGFLDNGPSWIQCDFTLPAATFTNSGTPAFPSGTKYMTYPYIYLFDANEAGVADVTVVRSSVLYTKPSTTTLGTTVTAATTQYAPTFASSVTQAKNLLNLSNIWTNASLTNTSDAALSNAEVSGGSVAIKLRIPGSLIMAGMTIGRKYIIGVAPVLNKKPLVGSVSDTQAANTWDGRRYGNFTYSEFALTFTAGTVTNTEGTLGTIESVVVTFAAMSTPDTTIIY